MRGRATNHNYHLPLLPTHHYQAMTCPEMGRYYTAMTQDMGGKLSGYYLSLQQRYGDPRVYAQQQQAMRAQEARVVHQQKTQAASTALQHQQTQREQARKAHSERMSKRKAPSTHPGSKAAVASALPQQRAKNPKTARAAASKSVAA